MPSKYLYEVGSVTSVTGDKIIVGRDFDCLTLAIGSGQATLRLDRETADQLQETISTALGATADPEVLERTPHPDGDVYLIQHQGRTAQVIDDPNCGLIDDAGDRVRDGHSVALAVAAWKDAQLVEAELAS